MKKKQYLISFWTNNPKEVEKVLFEKDLGFTNYTKSEIVVYAPLCRLEEKENRS